MNSKWIFIKNPEGQPPIDPKSQEKFGEYSSIFEFIQNAIDAKKGDEVPIVKIRFGNVHKNKFSLFSSKEFETHLRISPRIKNVEDKLNEDNIETLILEDFNTTGIAGDPLRWGHKTSENKKNPLFRFNYCIGDEGKLEEADLGGSEGEGRQTFCHASEISTFFYYTVRENENINSLMLGFTYLGGRTIGDQIYNPLAHFGIEKNVGEGMSYARADAEEEAHKKFKEMFNISRSANETGLSVVIPFKSSNLTEENVLMEILDKYRVPVLRKKVKIFVENLEINSTNIIEISEKKINVDPILLKGFSKFVNSITEKSDQDKNFLLRYNPSQTSLVQQDDIENFDELVRSFNEGETISIKVPFSVNYKKQLSGSYVKKWMEFKTYYKLYIKKFPIGSTQPFEFNDYIRGYLPIFGMRRKLLMYSLIDVQDKEAMLLFKKSEGANHSIWKSKHPKLRFYKKGTYTKFIQFTNSLPGYIYDLISYNQADEDLQTSLPLFPFEDMSGIAGRESGSKQKVTPLVVPVIFKRLDKYNIEKIKDPKNSGFSIRGCAYTKDDINKKVGEMVNFIKKAEIELAKKDDTDEFKKRAKKTKEAIKKAERRIAEYKNFVLQGCSFYPLKINLEAAFDMEGTSNPFKYYHSNDFNFSDNKTFRFKRNNDVGIESADENKIVLEATSPNFTFSIRGFGKGTLEDVVLKDMAI